MRPYFECVMLDPVGLLLVPAHDTWPEQYAGSHTTTMIPQKLMRRLMLSSIWQRYERGQIPSLEAAATALAELPFVKSSMGTDCTPAKTIARCISHARSHFRELPAVAKFLKRLRDQLNLKLVCMANATREEMCELQNRFSAVFAMFETIVISGEEGVGRTSQHFMQVALQKAGIQPHHAHRCMYLDASADMQSVVAARSVGMHAVLIEPQQLIACMSPSGRSIDLEDLANQLEALASLSQQLPRPPPPTTSFQQFNTCSQDSTPSISTPKSISEIVNHHYGQKVGSTHYTSRRAYWFPSLTSEGVRIWDNFAQFLIAEVLNDPRFLPMQLPPANGLICFVDKQNSSVDETGIMDQLPWHENRSKECPASTLRPVMADASTLKDIPEDLDTTSIGLSVLHKFGKVSMKTINKVLDTMLLHVSRDDGVLKVYFDSERPRIDPVVVTNAVYLFHLADRGKEVEASERFVESVLQHRAYEDGTLYYNLGEAFLLQVTRLVHRFKEHFTRSGMRDLLEARLQESRTSAGWRKRRGEEALAMSMYMRACKLCGIAGAHAEEDAMEKEGLEGMQREDGWWSCHAYCRNGGDLHSWIGNEALTTAYSLAALDSSPQNQAKFLTLIS